MTIYFKLYTTGAVLAALAACSSASGPQIPSLDLEPSEVQEGAIVLSNQGDGTMPVINGVTVDLSQGAIFSENGGLTYGQTLAKDFEYIVGRAGSLVGTAVVQQTTVVAPADGLSLSRDADTSIAVAGDATLSGRYLGFIGDVNAPHGSGGIANTTTVNGAAQVTVNLGEGTVSGTVSERMTSGFVPFLPNKLGEALNDLTFEGSTLTAQGTFAGTASGGAATVTNGTVTAFPATVTLALDRETATGAASDLVGIGTITQRQTIRQEQAAGPALEFTTRETGVFVVD